MTDPLSSTHRLRPVALALMVALAAPLASVSVPAAAATQVRTADGTRYIFLAQGNRSSTMNASTEDLTRVRSLRTGNEALLYVRHRGAAYVIRDAETLRRAEAIFKPQDIIGAQQGELGRRQGELGRRQGELGKEQARLGLLQADARPREQGELGRQQGELGRRQGELGRQQGELGRQQDLLVKEQARLAKEAQAKIEALLADAIRRGLARRIG